MKCQVAVFLIVGWVILSLIGYLKKDGIYKNYYINTSSLIVEVELNKDFSVKNEIECFIYKDGNFVTEKGKIFAQ